MNLRRELLCALILLIFSFTSSSFGAPEPELDEVIDLTNVVKPKSEKPKGTKRESQEATIDEQVNEYGEGGSGLKVRAKKQTLGERLSTIEEKKSAEAAKKKSAEAAAKSANATPPPIEEDTQRDEQANDAEDNTDLSVVAPPAKPEVPAEDILEPAEILESSGKSGEPAAAPPTLESVRDPISSSYAANPKHGEAHHECSCAKRTQFEPYVDRRQKWAKIVNLGTSFFSPVNYEPEYSVGKFTESYGQGAGEAFELSAGVKLNLGRAGALAVLAGGGQYKKTALTSAATLTLNPVFAGATYYLDTLFKEPYVVPYFGGGAYTLFYKESLASNAVGGRSGFGFYYSVGLAFQLDWMDEYGDLHQYSESDIENTFIYIEARGTSEVVTPESIKQKNFSNMFHAAAGLRFEF